MQVLARRMSGTTGDSASWIDIGEIFAFTARPSCRTGAAYTCGCSVTFCSFSVSLFLYYASDGIRRKIFYEVTSETRCVLLRGCLLSYMSGHVILRSRPRSTVAGPSRGFWGELGDSWG